jgi:hypothetical protein
MRSRMNTALMGLAFLGSATTTQAANAPEYHCDFTLYRSEVPVFSTSATTQVAGAMVSETEMAYRDHSTDDVYGVTLRARWSNVDGAKTAFTVTRQQDYPHGSRMPIIQLSDEEGEGEWGGQAGRYRAQVNCRFQ